MKLWEKGYDLNKVIEKFTVGDDYLLDQKLVKYDVAVNLAHAEMLFSLNYIEKDELEKIKKVLKEIIELDKKGKFVLELKDEDIHTKVENYLTNKLGNVGKKIHFAKSRNDQILTDIRMYTKDELDETKNLIIELKKSLEKISKLDVNMPGYTHMQKAMPSSVKLWAEAFVESLDDNLKLIESAYNLNNQCPLGTGAGYGLPIKIDRKLLAEKLGFSKVQKNPIYAQNSRGKIELFTLNAINQTMLDINKITEAALSVLKKYGSVMTDDQVISAVQNLNLFKTRFSIFGVLVLVDSKHFHHLLLFLQQSTNYLILVKFGSF